MTLSYEKRHQAYSESTMDIVRDWYLNRSKNTVRTHAWINKSINLAFRSHRPFTLIIALPDKRLIHLLDPNIPTQNTRLGNQTI